MEQQQQELKLLENCGDLLACSYDKWSETFKDVIVDGDFIYLSNSFLSYLNMDGIFLPSKPENVNLLACDPRCVELTNKTNKQEWEQEMDDWKEEEEEVKVIPCFEDLELKILEMLNKFGTDNGVFPKVC